MESVEDYAERRKLSRVRTKAELEDQIAELEEANQELHDRLDAVADLVNDEDDDDDDEDETGERAKMTTRDDAQD